MFKSWYSKRSKQLWMSFLSSWLRSVCSPAQRPFGFPLLTSCLQIRMIFLTYVTARGHSAYAGCLVRVWLFSYIWSSFHCSNKYFSDSILHLPSYILNGIYDSISSSSFWPLPFLFKSHLSATGPWIRVNLVMWRSIDGIKEPILMPLQILQNYTNLMEVSFHICVPTFHLAIACVYLLCNKISIKSGLEVGWHFPC